MLSRPAWVLIASFNIGQSVSEQLVVIHHRHPSNSTFLSSASNCSLILRSKRQYSRNSWSETGKSSNWIVPVRCHRECRSSVRHSADRESLALTLGICVPPVLHRITHTARPKASRAITDLIPEVDRVQSAIKGLSKYRNDNLVPICRLINDLKTVDPLQVVHSSLIRGERSKSWFKRYIWLRIGWLLPL